MKTRLILLAFLTYYVSAGEGCNTGKLVKDPLTGKVTRETPKEVETECVQPKTDLNDFVSPLDVISGESEEEE